MIPAERAERDMNLYYIGLSYCWKIIAMSYIHIFDFFSIGYHQKLMQINKLL